MRDLLGDWLPTWASFVIAFAVVTYLSVVFGELVPKALTLDRAETLAALVARPVELIAKVLRPVVWVLQGSGALLLRPFGITEVMAGDVGAHARGAARDRRRGRGLGRDPARAGGAAAQRLRLRRRARSAT